MNIARTTFHFSLVLSITTFLIACGGVDEGDTPDYSTPTGCIQDEWTQTVANSRGTVELTYEFLEDGTFIERSYADNISTADVIGGDTDIDLDILPGIGIDVGALINLWGVFMVEGYFYTEGTWELNDETGLIALTLPKTVFGHSIWSASAAKLDFRLTTSESSLGTTEQYAYCAGDQLVMGAFKGNDSDISGEWDSVANIFTVADDHESATYEYRDEDGDVYLSKSFRLSLENDGYHLTSCARTSASESRTFWMIDDSTEERVNATGVKVPKMTGSKYFTVLTDQFLYRYDAGLLTRFDVMSGTEVTLINTVEEPHTVESTLIPGGFVAIETYLSGESYITRALDDGSAFVRMPLSSGTYKEPVTFNGDAVLANYDTGDVYFLKSGENTLSPISFNNIATSVVKTRVTAQSVEGELFVSQLGETGAAGIEYPHLFWKYSTESGQFEKLTEFNHVANIYKIIPGIDGYDVYGANFNSRTHHFVHLDENNDYSVSSVLSIRDVNNQLGLLPSGSFDSQFYAPINNNPGRGIYIVNALLGTTVGITEDGFNISEMFKTESGSIIITQNNSTEIATVFDRNSNWSSLNIDTWFYDSFSAASVGEYYAFQSRKDLYFGNGTSGSLEYLGADYAYGEYDGRDTPEFFSSDAHMGIQASKGKSQLELLLFNEQTETFDFFEINTLMGMGSYPRLVGRMGDRTLISAWDNGNSCTGNPIDGVLKMESGFLWLDSSATPFQKTIVFDRM